MEAEVEVYTDASKLDGRIGIGIFCGHPNLQMNLARKIEEEISINSAEIFAIFKATEHICASSVERALILTDSKSSYYTLEGAIEGDEDNRLATKIVNMIAESTKIITIKWIPGLGNENADELAK
jgi:ribonuclease HI